MNIIKHRTDVGKFSLINRTITDWNNLSAVTKKTFPHNVNVFIYRIKHRTDVPNITLILIYLKSRATATRIYGKIFGTRTTVGANLIESGSRIVVNPA